MAGFDGIARFFGMSDEAWRRHANPWSVYTRFAAIPAMILAIWSRVWFGWWALVPVAIVIIWLMVNPHIFAPVSASHGWAARGIYGERYWLENRRDLSRSQLLAFRRLAIPGFVGLGLLAWGLVALSIWPTLMGAFLVTATQLWRIDRLGRLYDDRPHSSKSE